MEPIRRSIAYEPSFEFEDMHEGPVVGLDEAGCGAWVGPVVAGAAFVSKFCDKEILKALNDSKRLTAKVRDHLYEFFQTNPHHVQTAIGITTLEEIEKLNIRQAALLAMKRAYENLGIGATVALVDGTGKPHLPCPTHLLVKGDQRSYSIAAASIMAKVSRDRLMKALGIEFPAYGWDKNAGYGTAHHQEALQKYGVTPHHRKTYKPIKALLGEAQFSFKL